MFQLAIFLTLFTCLAIEVRASNCQPEAFGDSTGEFDDSSVIAQDMPLRVQQAGVKKYQNGLSRIAIIEHGNGTADDILNDPKSFNTGTLPPELAILALYRLQNESNFDLPSHLTAYRLAEYVQELNQRNNTVGTPEDRRDGPLVSEAYQLLKSMINTPGQKAEQTRLLAVLCLTGNLSESSRLLLEKVRNDPAADVRNAARTAIGMIEKSRYRERIGQEDVD